ncbi:UNVERIFIED_CONTAM: hypothetical protein FKN15_065509 [Acipenser sinensis]
MNTRCPPKRVPSAVRFFTLCRLAMQPPQSYSVGGQRSSGQLTGKIAGARPDYRGRWCANDLEQVLRQIGDKDQKIQNLEALLQKSKDSITQLETERDDLCAKIQAGEGETAVLNQLQEKNHALQVQVEEKLKEQLSQELNDEKEKLTELQKCYDSTKESQSKLQSDLHGKECELSAIRQDLKLKAKTELLLSAEAAKAAQRADLQNHLETAQHGLQALYDRGVSQNTIIQVSTKLEDKKEHCSQLESNLKESKEKLLNSEQKIEQLEGQVKKHEADLQEVQTNREQLQQDLEKQKKQSSEKENKVKELCKQLDAEKGVITTIKEELQKKSSALEEAKQQLTKQEEDKVNLKQDLEKLRQEAKTRQEELSNKAQALMGNLQKTQQEKESLLKDLAAMKENQSKVSQSLKESQTQLEKQKQNEKEALDQKEKTHQKVNQELHKKAESAAKEVNEVKSLLQKKDEAERELKSQLASVSTQLLKVQEGLKEKEKAEQQLQTKLKGAQESSTQEIKKLEAQLTDLQTVHLQKTTEEKLMLAQEELVTNRNQLTSHSQLIQELKTAKTELEQDVVMKNELIRQQEKALQEEQKQKTLKEEELKKEKSKAAELNKLKTKLEKEVSKLTEEHRTLKEQYEKELTDLKDAQQLLIQQKLDTQGVADSFRSALEQEKKEHKTTREAIGKREEELKKEQTQRVSKLDTELKAKEEQRKRHEEAEAKLTMQITALNENIGTLKKEWQSSQQRVGVLEKQTDDLRGEIAVLEATVQNNQDERRALLERCLKGEGEMEKHQTKMMEMRRKLDDTTAAMQELGRENQTLQIKNTQALTRKWAEDHEVQNCMGCGKGFSVTVRKSVSGLKLLAVSTQDGEPQYAALVQPPTCRLHEGTALLTDVAYFIQACNSTAEITPYPVSHYLTN